MKKFYDMQATEGSYRNSSSKLQTVYIPQDTKSHLIVSLLQANNVIYKNTKQFVKQKEVFVFTPKELKQLLQDYTNKIVKNVRMTGIAYGNDTSISDYEVDKESVINQLELFLKDLL